MIPVDENRRMAVQVLKSNNFEIIEHNEAILGSKNRERGNEGIVCLLLEVPPPYNKIKAWGDNDSHAEEGNIGRLVSSLNDDLYELRRLTRGQK